MDTALVNTAVAFVSAVLGAWFGHRLSVSEERRRHRFVCLMDLDRIFADSAQHLSGGQLANASRLKADMITLAVQTEEPAIWGPVLAFTNGVEELRDADGMIPAPDDPSWNGWDFGVRQIGEAVAMAKVRAMAALLTPRWYQRPKYWYLDRRSQSRAKSQTPTSRETAPD